MKISSTLSVLGFGLVITLLSACSETQPVAPVVVETRTVQVQRPAPTVPAVDQLRLRSVQWRIITPENVDEVFSQLSSDRVLFALSTDGYESLALNLSDLRAMIEQQQRVLAVYENSYR